MTEKTETDARNAIGYLALEIAVRLTVVSDIVAYFGARFSVVFPRCAIPASHSPRTEDS
jgi:hypothetical protein